MLLLLLPGAVRGVSVALASIPRSGNHLFRRHFESFTGIATHAVYDEPGHDCAWRGLPFCVARRGANANATLDPQIMLVKTHFPFLRDSTGAALGCAEAAILLYREPIANYASWRRYAYDSYKERVELASFVNSSVRFLDHWQRRCAGSLLVVRYRDLLEAPNFVMASVVRFLRELVLTSGNNSLRAPRAPLTRSWAEGAAFPRLVNCSSSPVVRLDEQHSAQASAVRDELERGGLLQRLDALGTLRDTDAIVRCTAQHVKLVATEIERRAASGRVPVVVFVTSDYEQVTRRWLQRLELLGCASQVLVLSLSRQCRRLVRDFTDVGCIELQPLETHRFTSLMRARILFVAQLVQHVRGVPFITCDVDAFWQDDVSDALRRLAKLHGADMLFSRGTFPPAHNKAHGFTNCAGFWYVVPSARTRFFLSEVASESSGRIASDQLALNEQLLRWSVAYERLSSPRDAWLGRCKLADELRLRVLNLPYGIVSRSCPTTAPIAHCLSEKTSDAKLRVELDPLPLTRKLRAFVHGASTANDTNAFEGGAWTHCVHLRNFGVNFDFGLGRSLAHVFRPSTLLEIGTGLGLYLDYALRFGERTRFAVGVEPNSMVAAGVFGRKGGPVQLVADVCAADFPRHLLPRFELVMSIEVLEHVERRHHSCFIDTLVACAKRWIIFSAAHPGQGGVGHIAERPRSEWIGEFVARGLVYRPRLTEQLQRNCSARNRNHRENVAVFSRAADDALPAPLTGSTTDQEIRSAREIWPHLEQIKQRCA